MQQFAEIRQIRVPELKMSEVSSRIIAIRTKVTPLLRRPRQQLVERAYPIEFAYAFDSSTRTIDVQSGSSPANRAAGTVGDSLPVQ